MPKLSLYNTLTRKKTPFKPIDPANVRMYVCGPTVYDYAHIGNARPIIVFDVLYRLLRHIYGESHVTYARNITDVDDKINARAAEEYPDLPLNDAIAKVTTQTTKQFHEDIAALGVLKPEDVNVPGEPKRFIEPTCTGHIKQMIAMIDVLESKGYAYEAEGHMLLDTTEIDGYGRLSGRSLDEMIAGARVEVAPYKRNPADSVLWKPSSDAQPGWDSPWGRGRPGWHIECSAMAKEHLGEVFDIHGGGIDLAFPHHENELAQSCSAHGTDVMANVWMHNGFLQVEGEKMSKSLGNFLTINELLSGRHESFELPWVGDAIRLAMLMTHYRHPIDWTTNSLATAGANLFTFQHVGTGGLGFDQNSNLAEISEIADGKPSNELLRYLMDDLNTPGAILSHLFALVKEADQKGGIREEPARQLLIDCLFLGLDPFRFARELHASWVAHKNLDEALVNEEIGARNAARDAKNFAEADRIRDELASQGITLKDGPDGTTWEIAR